MKFFQPVLNLLTYLWRWLRRSPHAVAVAWLWALGVMLLCHRAGYHESFLPQIPSNVDDLPVNWVPTPTPAHAFLYLLAYFRLFILVGGVVFHVYLLRAFPDPARMLRPTEIASACVTLWALATVIYERWEQSRIGMIGEEVSNVAFVIHVLLMVGLLVSPPFMIRYYMRSRIMERYTMRCFLQPLAFCFVAFTTLWIVMDLKDHLEDFSQNKISGGEILLFYVKMLPTIYVTVAPVTLLLATLYSLGRMSRANELISMLGAGRSLGQVLRPFFVAGLYASFLGMVANYHWAPQAEGNKKKLLEDVKEHVKRDILVTGLVYRNNEDRRTWFVGTVPADLRRENMRRVEVRQEDERGNLVKAWHARSAAWWPDARIWTFYTGSEVAYENGVIVGIKPFDFGEGRNRKDEEGWSETPWILMSGSLSPEFLGVPQLISYMQANKAYGAKKLAPFYTHLFYRFALPWQAFVVVLVAAPLGVVFSRRGLLGGVAGTIFVFFFLLFIDHLFLNLGKTQRLPSFVAVWMPHIILGSVGYYLYTLRSQNRELPSFNLKSMADAAAALWQTTRARFSRGLTRPT